MFDLQKEDIGQLAAGFLFLVVSGHDERPNSTLLLRQIDSILSNDDYVPHDEEHDTV